MLKIIFLGTCGSIPTPNRGMPALMVLRGGERMMFDCGEGTQRQMMRARSGFMDVTSIFLSHFHADHTLGIPGLMQTMSFQGRTEPLYIYGPEFVEEYCRLLNSLGYLNLSFPVIARRLEHGDKIESRDYEIEAFRTFHGVAGLGYVLREKPRPGRFNKAKALELGVPEGPLFSRLHRGEAVVVGGREIQSEEVVGRPRPGRAIVYTGDTVPSEAFLPYLRDADVWISECTFADEMAAKAEETMHSTAGGVARLAAQAGVKLLILTHISSRYVQDPAILLADAMKYFGNVVIADDFMEVEIPLVE